MTNLADHLKASAEIRKHVEDADALSRKLGAILNNARATLEALTVYAPNDAFKIKPPYHLRNAQGDDSMSMRDILKRQCDQINETLGDRA